MFQRLVGWIPGIGQEKIKFAKDDPRIAAVALMFQIVAADGEDKSVERHMLAKLLQQKYSIDAAALKAMIEAGEKAFDETDDVLTYCRILKYELSDEERIGFIGLLWDIAYADGTVYELEENLVWRIAELIGVDDSDRIQQQEMAAAKYCHEKDQSA